MPAHHCSGPPRALSLLTALFAALALLCALPGAARAAGGPPRPSHPGRDWMGVTVRPHEGGGHGAPPPAPLAFVEGVDVSSHNGNVPWGSLYRSGVRFAWAKATEGTSYTNPYFTQQYDGPYQAGMIRGAYHFALPDNSSGAAQAAYFAGHGGGWSADGRTLPGVLDMEYNPYGEACYGLSARQLTHWMADFFATYRDRTGRDAVLYTTTGWWHRCTGDYTGFGSVNPLWTARYGATPGALPAGWSFHTVWQYTDSGPTVGDHDRFNGSYARLKALADG
ncbi:lysozyme [Streptomyces orinoci]|uniref:Lysozyme n=1 Tax=Streptomyces orinoci TaxID=67339 RepID=A0ABV3JT68_STRON|nr:lysozyme [Streptomyces orinoci]